MKAEKKQPVSPKQIGIAVVAGLALIGGIGYFATKGPSYPNVPTYRQLNDQALDLAVKYKGDATKLTVEEKSIVDGASRNRAKDFMRTGYQLRMKQASGKT